MSLLTERLRFQRPQLSSIVLALDETAKPEVTEIIRHFSSNAGSITQLIFLFSYQQIFNLKFLKLIQMLPISIKKIPGISIKQYFLFPFSEQVIWTAYVYTAVLSVCTVLKEYTLIGRRVG